MMIETGGLTVGLRQHSYAIQSLGYKKDDKYGKNFSFVPPLFGWEKSRRDMPGAHHVGDLTLRVQPLSSEDPKSWAMYSSARGGAVHAVTPSPSPLPAGVVASHDITPALLAPGQLDTRHPLGLNVTRTWETGDDGLIMRFRLTAGSQGVRVGGLGMSLVPDASWGNEKLEQIGQTLSFLEPSIAHDHGFATWTRIDGSQTLLVTPLNGTRFEAYRPVLEDAAHVQAGTYEWTALSSAWEAEWRENKQMPRLSFQGDTSIWQNPKGMWPSWQGNETFGNQPPTQWNPPTSLDLKPGESAEFGLKFSLAEGGPRTRDAQLANLGRAVVHAVPGYVVTPDMASAKLLVKPPAGAKVVDASVEPAGILVLGNPVAAVGSAGYTEISVSGTVGVFKRCRVAVSFSDGTEAAVHYFSIGRSLQEHVGNYSAFLADTAWLPVDYPDPFSRGASIAAWDRESQKHLLQDGRTFIVGLSDDAGGGNHLGFASKVAGAPTQHEVSRIDDYIRYTLYGPKPEKYPWLADPHFQLQEENDRILMTVFYYHYNRSKALQHSKALQWQDWEGKDYYTELNKCYTAPSWCGFNAITDDTGSGWHPADYRAFNFPHQVASYYAMYRAARNYGGLKTLQTWQWYLERAANTSIAMGSPSTGLMDGTIFREVLLALRSEGMSELASKLEANMRQRVNIWNQQEFPYGSEFNWDTTGQEECAIWGAFFNSTNEMYGGLDDRVVDAILAFQPSTWNWAWHGSAEGWGDFGNNAKWMITGGWEREGQHYRAGLNSIPLGERFRRNPDELYLLEVTMGAITGTLTNIDEDGAPSMGFHLHPFVLQHDPNSGDYGLGFFGATMNQGAYLVQSDELGWQCYLCDLSFSEGQVPPSAVNRLRLEPRDAYRQRIYVEPLGLELRAQAGFVKAVDWDMSGKKLVVILMPGEEILSAARLEVNIMAASRGVIETAIDNPMAKFERGAYTIGISASDTTEVTISYKVAASPMAFV